ncbi:hypothetical protein H4696_006312 [Amycolatopsis lexingtonensis]|uniref:DUF320 domain-containing protein n=1 Tax=Amycolatopsis lexingtonensis TaxID=218822 RepID=A0ABR9I7Q1_9PSEU|nr:hypothetical protein [Amycolatopsis lexingtonensis]MBE1499212.1 hypothetical protein [Amycolatopsis lexingtonensis]
MSSTANSRRSAPGQAAFTAGEERRAGLAGATLIAGRTESPRARGRAPRPWTASLQRPAAKILVAGGLTLAGWLLTAALSGSTAGAAEQVTCPQAPVASTVDHPGKSFLHGKHHRKSHRETGAATCAQQTGETPAADTQPGSEPTETTPVDATAAETTPTDTAASEPKPTETKPVETEPAAKTQPAEETTAAEQPAAETQNTLSTQTTEKPQAGLLGGLVGGVLNVVGGTLTTVTSTVGVVTDTLSHTVLAPLTQPPANHPDAPVLLPLDDVLGPILNGGSNSGGVTATVPAGTTVVATVTSEVPAATVVEAAPAEAAPQSAGRGAAHFVVVRHELPQQVKQEQPRDSGVHARDGGGDTTPGLPGGTTAPSAPAPTATPGHDGPGGARHAFAVHTDDVTTTQLKLIGTSRDHDVDGAGREAALPTTSPD